MTKFDGSAGLPLPRFEERRIHRISVSLGASGSVPIKFGDFGKGFVHVLDERAVQILFRELDTITDFVEYLVTKERWFAMGKKIVFSGAEEDLLALYLHNGREFPLQYDGIVVDDTLWSGFQARPEYRAKRVADSDSFYWDRVIEVLTRSEPEVGPSLNEAEAAIRVMAREDRFARRLLGKSLIEFLESKRARSRMTVSPSGVAYVFLAVPHGTDAELLRLELTNRCFAARGINKDCKTVVGIGTEYFKDRESSLLFFSYLRKDKWLPEDDADLKSMQAELGYFSNPEIRTFREDEYPGTRQPSSE